MAPVIGSFIGKKKMKELGQRISYKFLNCVVVIKLIPEYQDFIGL